MDTVHECEFCNAGVLHTKQETNQVEYLGLRGQILCEFSYCESCETEVAFPEQVSNNKQRMTDFKNMVTEFLKNQDKEA